MKNLQVGWHLDQIADFLELQDANPHKIRAFRRAARKLASFPQPIEEIDLKSIPGIGEKIAEEVNLFLQNGETPLLKSLKGKIPEAVLEIKDIPGVDLKTAYMIFRSGKIKSKERLRQAIKKRELRQIPGIGAKVEKDIKDYFQQTREGAPFLLSLAENEAEKIKNSIENSSAVDNIAITGPVRRGEMLIEEVTILVGTRKPEAFKKEVQLLPRASGYSSIGESSFQIKISGGVPIKFILVPPEEFISKKILTTGPCQHWDYLVKKAKQKGYDLTEKGLFSGREPIPLTVEDDLYSRLSLPQPPPPTRHRQTGESSLSFVEKIVDLNEIKGDLHLHTNWSDGGSTVEEMVKKAREMGYEYLAVTDHSMALEFAGGMSLAALQEQMEYIDRLNEQIGQKFVLKGIEADIELDGSLDVPQRFLDKMDWVVASVHRGLKLPRAEMTRRLVKAVSHPSVRVLGHPTCRLFPGRKGIDVDIKEVFSQASQNQTVMEINGAPDRRDLDEQHVHLALDFGLEFCLGSDAHNDQNMEYMVYAVIEAQRAGLPREKIINTKSLEQICRD